MYCKMFLKPHYIVSMFFRPHHVLSMFFRPHHALSMFFRPHHVLSMFFRPHYVLSNVFKPHYIASMFLKPHYVLSMFSNTLPAQNEITVRSYVLQSPWLQCVTIPPKIQLQPLPGYLRAYVSSRKEDRLHGSAYTPGQFLTSPGLCLLCAVT
jgi:hypothetical protein